jgi:hypothetical protein
MLPRLNANFKIILLITINPDKIRIIMEASLSGGGKDK